MENLFLNLECDKVNRCFNLCDMDMVINWTAFKLLPICTANLAMAYWTGGLGLGALSGSREVPTSNPVNSYSSKDNFSQLNP